MPTLNIPTAPVISASPITMLLNGMLAFLSPCILPMLPVYAAYIIGNMGDNSKITKQTLLRLLALVLGFVLVFVILGAFAGLAGSFNSKINRNILEIVGNVLLIIFGFMMLELIPGLSLGNVSADTNMLAKGGFIQNMLFGAVLVLSWTPCLTPLLGNALIAAASSQQATALNGMYMLGMFALGLSIPLVVIMLLYQKLSALVTFLKKSHMLIRKLAGVAMIVIGIFGLLKNFNII